MIILNSDHLVLLQQRELRLFEAEREVVTQEGALVRRHQRPHRCRPMHAEVDEAGEYDLWGRPVGS